VLSEAEDKPKSFMWIFYKQCENASTGVRRRVQIDPWAIFRSVMKNIIAEDVLGLRRPAAPGRAPAPPRAPRRASSSKATQQARACGGSIDDVASFTASESFRHLGFHCVQGERCRPHLLPLRRRRRWRGRRCRSTAGFFARACAGGVRLMSLDMPGWERQEEEKVSFAHFHYFAETCS
jgi:hypothetical protein